MEATIFLKSFLAHTVPGEREGESDVMSRAFLGDLDEWKVGKTMAPDKEEASQSYGLHAGLVNMKKQSSEGLPSC